MGTIFICAALACIVIYTVYSYYKKLTGETCCSGNYVEKSEKKLKIKDKNKNNYLYKVKIKIEGMVCQNCTTRVENALNSNDGIYAKVDLADHVATILMKNELSESDIRKIVSDSGYVVKEYQTIK